MLTDTELSDLKGRCLRAKRLGGAIANAELLVSFLEDEAGGDDAGRHKPGSPAHLLLLVGKVQAARSGAAAKPVKAKKKAAKKKAAKKDAPAEDAPAEDAPAEDAPAEDAPAEDAPAEDAPAADGDDS